MNTDDTRFDRLVDEELSEEERRQLLGQLDDEPGGWRRCALAFLEAQCWRQAFGELPNLRDSLSAALGPAGKYAAEKPALPGQTSLPFETPPRTLWLGRLKVLSAMAASFLAAMWLGTMAQRAWVGQPRGLPGSGGGSGTYGSLAVVKESHPSLTPNVPENNLVSSPPRASSASRPWRMVTVSATSDGQHPQSSIEVPAVERDNIDEQWLRSVPPAIPENVLRALTRTGHQIEQQREFVPVPLKDGRQLVVPVDRVNVHYIGNGPY
jgi:hypothetical protein